ncbi:MAG: transglutaminase domain-containing protein [Acidobacteria bacterium]|nr:transglutaminase domain-containing protein [Acidobacteriota bacterium]
MRLRTFVAAAFALSLSAQTVRYRQWMGGREVGGASDEVTESALGRTAHHTEWVKLDRFGLEIRQDLTMTAMRTKEGDLRFAWSLKLSNMPMEGAATWSPAAPRLLHLAPKGGAARDVAVPADAILWPQDEDEALKAAARNRAPLRYSSFSFPTSDWGVRVLSDATPDPLPGHPDAIRFSGQDQQGSVTAPLEVWVSPEVGELKEHSQLGGMDLWLQRADLPAPSGPLQENLFDRTVRPLPPDALREWRPSLSVTYEGGTAPELPETAQQTKTGPRTWRLSRAVAPDAAEAADLPVRGTPSKEDAPYLAATPLLQFHDPAFDGLLARMALKPGLSRWQIAGTVTDFVFSFIRDKTYSVGFASALEVCKHPTGDCTEHGVLAVALLRKLGVPARGVLGWVGLGNELGMHFWVEVKLKHRWVPVDPTLDQVPASAFHLALGATDLADLGSLGWDKLSTALGGGAFVPVETAAPTTLGASVLAPDRTRLTWMGAAWQSKDGQLTLTLPDHSAHSLLARTAPIEAELKNARRLQGSTGRDGWWDAKAHRLYLDCGDRRWLQMDPCTETQAFAALDALEIHDAR